MELVSGHMAINLITNTRDMLEGFPVGEMYCRLESTVTLHWIQRAGNYSLSETGLARSTNIKQWCHATSQENPEDLGSIGENVQEEELWCRDLNG